jgi:predicted flap endonuclease-1-like 5' DNA nuclease
MISSTYLKSKKKYKVSFELPQDQVGEGRDVRVLGSFNDWSWDKGVQLKNGKKGYTATAELPAGNYQFRYLVDGHHWINDDSADSYTDSGQGTTNCCLNLEEVAEAPKKEATKKAPAKKKPAAKKDAKMEAADSAPASKPVVTPKKTAKPKATTKAKTESKAKPAAKKAPSKKTASKGDDLKKIEGIGPKIAGLLNEDGVHTFSDLAKASDKQLADVLQKAGARFRLAKYDTWSDQAKLAAEGKMEELKKMQTELKGGRK